MDVQGRVGFIQVLDTGERVFAGAPATPARLTLKPHTSSLAGQGQPLSLWMSLCGRSFARYLTVGQPKDAGTKHLPACAG